MSLLWQTLTFSVAARDVTDLGYPEAIRLKPYQVLLWVSITHRGLQHLPSGTPRLPVLLDTGHNHNLSLREEHLAHSGLETPWPWSGSSLKVRDASGIERDVPRLFVDVWLHRDAPQPDEKAHPLRLGFRGAACYPTRGSVQGPHLPLLGLAALCAGSLSLEFECHPAGGTIRLFVPATA